MNPKLMMSKQKYEGSIFKTNNCGECVVVEYTDAKNVLVNFLDTGNMLLVSAGSLRSGRIKDYLKPSVFGVGILGKEFTSEDRNFKEYVLWKNMLKRCYCEKSLISSPMYADCTVSNNFKYYPYFKEWCEKQIGFGYDDWQLDKDLLIKGNKIYSEDTCCFVPREINSLLLKSNNSRGNTIIGVHLNKRNNRFQSQFSVKDKKQHLGWFDTELEAFLAYKEAKEAYVKEVANKWRDKIDPRVYDALLRYEVEITD